MFYLLYYTESMGLKNSFCLITSTKYSINQHILIIKGLKSKPFKNDLRDQLYFLQIKKLPYLSYDVCCNNLPLDVNTAFNLYWPIYQNSPYRGVRHWSINSLLRAL